MTTNLVEEKPKPKFLKKVTRTLPCKLTDEELRNSSDELASTVQEINAEEERQKNQRDLMKAQMSELVARQTKLAMMVCRREDFRDVEVIVELHENDIVTERRKDTGDLLFTRPARDDERQLDLV